MTEPTIFEARLRQGLVQAIEARQRVRPRPVRRLVLSGAVALVIVAFVFVALPSWFGTASALAVTRQDDRIVIDLRDPQASLSTMEEELESAGVNAEVRRIAVSPSLAGQWIGATLPSGAPAVAKDHQAVPHQPGTNRIVLRFEPGSRVVLFLGEQAGKDARYLVSTNAFRPGEALNCSGIGGLATDRAAQALAGRGLTVRWFPMPAAGQAPSVLKPSDTPPPGVVSGAEMESATTVRVSVTPPGQPAPADLQTDGVEFVLHELVTGTDPDDVPVSGRLSLTTAGSAC